jgi:hypothetical protein
MDNGNVGPGNRTAQNFERSMSEAPQFNPEILPTPDDKENDPGNSGEVAGNNPNANSGLYIDPSMLGASTVQAIQFEQPVNPALGEVVDDGVVGPKRLNEEQISGTDVDISKFQKNGVSKELEEKLDNLKKEPNLYKQSIDFMLEAKKSLSSSFADRGYLAGGDK